MSLLKTFRLQRFAKSALRYFSHANVDAESRSIKYLLKNELQGKPLPNQMPEFGKTFTDHMLSMKWDQDFGWYKPVIKPMENICLHPAASVLHYAIELFEGMKAYRTEDNRVLMFRPMENINRMARSAERACLPTFDKEEMLNCISELVRVDKYWVPRGPNTSLYIRPTMIGTEPKIGIQIPDSALLFCIMSPVGELFESSSGVPIGPISLWADPQHVRVPEGGVGSYKLGCNYAPALKVHQLAKEKLCHQALWLYGPDQLITEAGVMNLFVFWMNNDGEKELVTMSLDMGLVLPGITRQSVIELTKCWNEFKVVERNVSMFEVLNALDEGRMLEMFATGTGGGIQGVDRIHYNNMDLTVPFSTCSDSLTVRLHHALADIKYGRVPHEWSYVVTDCA